MSQATPGPWRVTEDDINGLTQALAIVDARGLPVIAASSDYDRSLQRRGDVLFLDAYDADLQLAAAAPDLLAACKAFLEDEWADCSPHVADQMHAAITRATNHPKEPNDA